MVLSVVFLVIIVVAFILLFAFAIARRKEHLSGDYGERKITELIEGLKKDDERLINNFIARRNSKGTSSIQIDHIFISHKGVFVIETKDYRGRIYGDRNQNYWTQVLAYGEVKNKLYNPIKQNETHVNYIKSLIGDDIRIYNAVIFIKSDISRVNNSLGVLFDRSSFSYWYRKLPIYKISSAKIEELKTIILSEMEKNKISKEEHINNVQRRHGTY